MRVLAIDPGFGRCGVALLDGDASSAHILYSDTIETDAKTEFIDRLLVIAEEILRLIETYRPELVAIEELFFSNNQKTVFHVAEVRGVLMYLAVSRHIPLVQYNPLAIKIALTGHGRATKQEVMKMVNRLSDLSKTPKHDDEYDAIALGITALAGARSMAIRGH
jgi:crossover junction endodeoxyribonuclease RuvC